jgi:hypothetical protein
MKHLYEYLEFDDLSEEARKNAINNVRAQRYEDGDDICQWAIDDSELFEPPHEDMSKIFGEDYYEALGNRFMLGNSDPKKINFVSKSDPNYYITCSDAIDIAEDSMFLRWLGIPSRFNSYLYYKLRNPNYRNSSTIIEFDIENLDGLIEKFGPEGERELESYIEKAELKWESHMNYVLDKITSCIDNEYEDEGIIDHIENNDIKFTEDGEIDE